MTVEDDDLSALEQRMRAKLSNMGDSHTGAALSPDEQRIARKLIGEGKPTAHAFTDAEQRMAERLVGIDNVKRVANAKEGRRVRLAPVRIEYSWYEIPPGSFSAFYSWRIERSENGRRSTYAEGGDFDALDVQLAELRKAGHTVREIRMGVESNRHAPRTVPTSQRKTFADRFGPNFAATSGRKIGR